MQLTLARSTRQFFLCDREERRRTTPEHAQSVAGTCGVGCRVDGDTQGGGSTAQRVSGTVGGWVGGGEFLPTRRRFSVDVRTGGGAEDHPRARAIGCHDLRRRLPS